MSTDAAPPQPPSASKAQGSVSGIQNLLSSWGVHWQYLAAGSLARASSTFVIFPLDVVKTRLQVQGAASHVQSAQISGSNVAASVYVRSYNHPVDAFRSIVKEEGVGALYRGMLPRLLYIAPAAAVSFTCYEMMKYAVDHFDFGFDARRIIDPDKHHSPGQSHGVLTLGVAAATWFSVRLIGTASRTPFDILKQHLQIQGLLRAHSDQAKAIKKQNLRQVFKTVVKQHGYRGLFDGYWATVCRDLPFGALYYTAYEVVKRGQLYLLTRSQTNQESAAAPSPPFSTTHRLPLHPRQYEHEPNPKPTSSVLSSWNYMLAGACAGAFSSSLTIPLDVVKTRLQTARYLQYSAVAASMAAQGHTTIPPEVLAKLHNEAPYRNMRDAFAKIWRAEGVKGLTSGLGPRLMYVIPGSALTFTFYEFYKRALAQWTGEDFIEELPGRKDHSGGGI